MKSATQIMSAGCVAARWISLLAACWLVMPVTVLSATTGGLPEQAFLAAVESNPAQGLEQWQPVFPLGGDREAYDRAYGRCREALKSGMDSPDLRVNFGCLLLLRDHYYPSESGSLLRAVNQWYLALKRAPGNEAALHYLAADWTLGRVAREFAPPDLLAFEKVLSDAMQSSATASQVRSALVRFYLATKRPVEALQQAQKLADGQGGDDASVLLLLGIARLKNGLDVEAVESLGRALGGLEDLSSRQAALSAAVRAYVRINQLTEAEELLAKMADEQAEPVVSLAREMFDLPEPSILYAEIGQKYAGLGDAGSAVRFTGIEGLQWLSSERAYEANQRGLAAHDAGDHEAARRHFREAHELIPMEPAYLGNLAWTCHTLGRYRESVVAYRKRAALKPLDSREVVKIAQMEILLGETKRAYDELWAEAVAHPELSWLAEWTVVAAYAVHGRETAEQCWCRLLGRGGNRMNNNERFRVYALVSGGLGDFSQRAHAARMNYQALQIDSLYYRALGEALNSYLLSEEGFREVRAERKAVLERIMTTYARLPVKPKPSGLAAELALKAGAELENGRWWNAVPLYYQAAENAPYWPEGHFMLGAALTVATQYDNFWLNMSNGLPDGPGLRVFNDRAGASGEVHLNAYLRLKPDGELRPRALELLTKGK